MLAEQAYVEVGIAGDQAGGKRAGVLQPMAQFARGEAGRVDPAMAGDVRHCGMDGRKGPIMPEPPMYQVLICVARVSADSGLF